MIVFVVPWQVAFLGSWIYQLYICASIRPITPNASAPTIPNTPPAAQDSPIPLTLLNPDGETDTDESHSRSSTPPTIPNRRSSSPPIMAHNNRSAASDFETWRHANEYLLVLMTWLLPLVVPVLAVWVRTMAMVGFGVGKGGIDVGGDHQPGWVAPFLVLVEGMWASGVVRVRSVFLFFCEMVGFLILFSPFFFLDVKE